MGIWLIKSYWWKVGLIGLIINNLGYVLLSVELKFRNVGEILFGK